MQGLSTAPIVLASASPRRRELLAALGIAFTVIATDAEECVDTPPDAVLAGLPPLDLVVSDHPTLRAWRKASAVLVPGAVVLGVDTTVVIDGMVLNKPQDDADGRRMLAHLSGRTHLVHSGICVLSVADGSASAEAIGLGTQWMWLSLVTSEVEFYDLTSDQIAAYVASGEPHDKAGAYGIQGRGGQLVRAVRGSYTNVVGLPLGETAHLLAAAGVAILRDPAECYRQWVKSQGKEPLPCPPTQP
ncbi:MAG: septum formation protein Maf [Oscillochloris sp.]|nr:septum formation protein Maf [Oscillochloris sp.]